MDIKKILALLIIALALFSCLGAASAGLFDFFGGGPKNQTYTFDGFTLDLPEGSQINDTKQSSAGINFHEYLVFFPTNANGTSINVIIYTGDNLVKTVDEYVNSLTTNGAKFVDKYGNWSIVDVRNFTSPTEHNTNVTGYLIITRTPNSFVVIRGDSPEQLKGIVDTYKTV
ncbi:MAG: hypothetical protein K6A34_03440 [Methanobrevibacter sp.]|nr:hypothetical protein [Methanobrevibacter sp.]